MKNFDAQAQSIWTADTLNEKRELLLEMINDFQYTAKQQMFLRKVENAKTKNKLDKLAADLMQLAHGNKVI